MLNPMKTDKRLVRQTLRGNREAFNALVLRHLPAVHAVAYSQTQNHADAEDVTQEAFLKAYEALPSLQDPNRFGPWVAAIARRAATGLFRAASRRRTREDAAVDHDAIAPVDLAAQEEHALLNRHLHALPEELRELLMLRYYAGKRVKEIAVLLEISPDAAAKRLQRAREALGEQMIRALEDTREKADQTSARARRIVAAAFASGALAKQAGAATSATAPALGIKWLALPIVLGLAVLGWQLLPGPPERAASEDFAAPAASAGDSAPANLALAQDPPEPTGAPTASEEEEPPTGIFGRVYDRETGEGLPGVEVKIGSSYNGAHLSWSTAATTTTDRAGAYQFAALAPDTYRITHGDIRGYSPKSLEFPWPVVTLMEEAAQREVDLAVDRGIRISGVVQDGQGLSLADAEIYAHPIDHSADKGAAVSDGDGRFDMVVPKTFTQVQIFAKLEGYAMAPMGPVPIPEAGLPGLVLTMNGESVLEGTLVDMEGAPLAGYRPWAWPHPHQVSNLYGIEVAESDPLGRFRIRGLFAGTWRIGKVMDTNDGEGYNVRLVEDVIVELGASDTQRGLRLVLDRAAYSYIRGRVTAVTGVPVADADVYASKRGVVPLEIGQTDRDGRYAFAGLPAGEGYSIQVRHALLGSATLQDVSTGRDDVDFVLSLRGAISGRVLDGETGAPIEAFEIRRPNGGESSFSDGEGLFRLSGIDTGRVVIKVSADGYTPVQEIVEVAAGETVEDIEIRLMAGRSFTGLVVDAEGLPVPRALVFLDKFPMSGMVVERYSAATTGTEGRFELGNLPAYIETIHVYHPRYAPGSAAIPAARDQVTITLGEGAVVSGQAQYLGNALAGLRVQVGDVSPAVYETVTGSDGMYRLEGLPEGTVRLQAQHLFEDVSPPYGRKLVQVVSVTPGAPVEHDLDFSPWDTQVEGRVTLKGSSIEASNVFLFFSYAHDNGDHDTFTAYPDTEGYYSIQGPIPGAARMEVWAPGAIDPERTAAGTAIFPGQWVEISEGTVNRIDFDVQLAEGEE